MANDRITRLRLRISEFGSPGTSGSFWAAPLVCAAFAAYCAVLVLTIPFHQPWADEAQAWLISRDLGFSRMLHEIAYEGSPPLWYSLLWVLNRAHLDYQHLGWVSGIIAASGIFLLLKYSPLPTALQVALPFTFYLQYQYAVINRNYVLFPVMAFSIAALYRERWRHPVWLAVALALMFQVSAHGALFSAGVCGALLVELWRQRGKVVISRRTYIAAGIVVIAGIFAVLVARTPGDCISTALTGNKFAHLALPLRLGAYALRGFRAFSYAASPWSVLSALLLGVAVLWLWRCRRLELLLPLGGVWMLLGFIWQGWHAGLIWVSFIAVLWMAWPDSNPAAKPYRAALAWLLLLASVAQLPWTASAVLADRRGAYSPAMEVARFLQSRQGRTIYGFHYHAVTMLPYFDHNIFANQPADHSYWHWGRDNQSDNLSLIERKPPDLAVIAWCREPGTPESRSDEVTDVLLKKGYQATRRFCGAMVMHSKIYFEPCFEIYEPSAENGAKATAIAGASVPPRSPGL